MSGDPALAQDAGVLGRPLEDRRLFGEAEIAPVIVVLHHPPTVAGGGSVRLASSEATTFDTTGFSRHACQ